MRKSRFTETQIIGMIKEQEAGMPTAEVCRKHGLSQGTFYKYKSKYGGMEVSDVAKLRAMRDHDISQRRAYRLVRCPAGHCAAMYREGVSTKRRSSANARPACPGSRNAVSTRRR